MHRLLVFFIVTLQYFTQNLTHVGCVNLMRGGRHAFLTNLRRKYWPVNDHKINII